MVSLREICRNLYQNDKSGLSSVILTLIIFLIKYIIINRISGAKQIDKQRYELMTDSRNQVKLHS